MFKINNYTSVCLQGDPFEKKATAKATKLKLKAGNLKLKTKPPWQAPRLKEYGACQSRVGHVRACQSRAERVRAN